MSQPLALVIRLRGLLITWLVQVSCLLMAIETMEAYDTAENVPLLFLSFMLFNE